MADLNDIYYVADSPTGDESGDSPDDFCSLDWLVTNRINNTGTYALAEPCDIRVCGDIELGGVLDTIVRDATRGHHITLAGYDYPQGTTRTEADISANGLPISVLPWGNTDYWVVREIHVTNTDKDTNHNGFDHIGSGAYNMTYLNCRMSDCYKGLAGTAHYCMVDRCIAHDCSRGGFYGYYSTKYRDCTAYDCLICFIWGDHLRSTAYKTSGGAAGWGLYQPLMASHCIVNGVTTRAIQCSTYGRSWLTDCIVANCSGYAYALDHVNRSALLTRCADYNCTSGRTEAVPLGVMIDDIDPIRLTADPFVDVANYDFSLNNAPGGGAMCRNSAGIWLPGGTTKSYHDVGCSQHKDRTIVRI